MNITEESPHPESGNMDPLVNNVEPFESKRRTDIISDEILDSAIFEILSGNFPLSEFSEEKWNYFDAYDGLYCMKTKLHKVPFENRHVNLEHNLVVGRKRHLNNDRYLELFSVSELPKNGSDGKVLRVLSRSSPEDYLPYRGAEIQIATKHSGSWIESDALAKGLGYYDDIVEAFMFDEGPFIKTGVVKHDFRP